MDALKLFDQLISSHLAPALQSLGFRRKNLTFLLKRADNFGVIWFQKNRWNTKEEVSFTVEVGTASRRLAAGSRGRFPPGSAVDCPWRERIGYLLPARGDKWWSILRDTASEALEALARELIGHFVERALPAIETHLSDEQLRGMWIEKFESHSLNPADLAHLILLVTALGPKELLPSLYAQKASDQAGADERLQDYIDMEQARSGGISAKAQALITLALSVRSGATPPRESLFALRPSGIPRHFFCDLSLRNDSKGWSSWVANVLSDPGALAALDAIDCQSILAWASDRQAEWQPPQAVAEAADRLRAWLKHEDPRVGPVLRAYALTSSEPEEMLISDLEDLAEIARWSITQGASHIAFQLDF